MKKLLITFIALSTITLACPTITHDIEKTVGETEVFVELVQAHKDNSMTPTQITDKLNEIREKKVLFISHILTTHSNMKGEVKTLVPITVEEVLMIDDFKRILNR